jgi:hypothetical protein
MLVENADRHIGQHGTDVRTLAVLVAIGAAMWLWTNHERHATEHRLAGIATQLAGRRVGVRCQGFWAAMLDIDNRQGEVDFYPGRLPDHMFLTRDNCSRLRHFKPRTLDCLTQIDWSHWSLAANYDAPCERRTRRDVEAINTLTHEAMHLRGFVAEGAAQCNAIRHDASTVTMLGGTAAEGRAASSFMLALEPLLPSEYQSGTC